MEADTAAAVAASVVGAVSLVVCAIALIREYVEPLGPGAVIVAGLVTGVLATVLLAGGAWAWRRDGRSPVE